MFAYRALSKNSISYGIVKLNWETTKYNRLASEDLAH